MLIVMYSGLILGECLSNNTISAMCSQVGSLTAIMHLIYLGIRIYDMNAKCFFERRNY